MDCDVAREALSARIDHEREPVPAALVDEHLETCQGCAAWYLLVSKQAEELRRLVGAARPRVSTTPPPVQRDRRVGIALAISRLGAQWPRWALGLVGIVQVAIGVAQATGASFGMLTGHHGAEHGVHLLNESTAWVLALGAVMIGAAVRPTAAAGLAGVLTVFTIVLVGYVIGDWFAGLVTPARVFSHLPVVLGTLLALLVWHMERRPRGPSPTQRPVSPEVVVPLHAVDESLPSATYRSSRRGRLRPVDGSAA